VPAYFKLDVSGRTNMALYITLVNWTDQGIKSIKEAPDRIDAVRAFARTHGCEMRDFYMTVGAYDMVATMEAPDDETMARIALKIGSAGNVRTTTLKAFSEDAFRKIVTDL
jgi:uncharacterized protein with GYD domain